MQIINKRKPYFHVVVELNIWFCSLLHHYVSPILKLVLTDGNGKAEN
jgi:hypothetical protein